MRARAEGKGELVRKGEGIGEGRERVMVNGERKERDKG